MGIKYEAWDSPRWETYSGAYGNICDDLKMLVGELPMDSQARLRRLDTEEKTDEQILFDNICENLSHQMSFYDASYLAMPYLVAFLEHKQGDFTWESNILVELGGILATDIPQNKGKVFIPDEILENYAASIARLCELTKAFMQTHTAEIRALEDGEREQLLIAHIAILGDRALAYILFMTYWQEYYFSCPHCDFCYEDEGEGAPEGQLVPASETCEPYRACYKMLCELGATDEEIRVISDYYGTLTCPECGAVMPMLNAMKYYLLGEE